MLTVLLPVGLMQAQPEPLNEAWRWARFGAASGLPSDRVLDVVETSNGVSWARTEARLAWYDTYQWHPVTIVENSTPQWPSRIVPDRQGGILAVASQRLYRVDQQGVSAIAIEGEAGRLAVRDVIPLDDEALLVLTLGGLYRHHPGGLDPFPAPEEVTPEEIAGSLFFTEVEGVWISTARGLFQWTGEGWVKRFDHATRLLRVGPWGGLAAVIDGPPSVYGLWTWTPGSPPRHVTDTGDGQGLITSLHADSVGNALVASASGQVWIRRDGRWTLLTPVPSPLVNPRFIRAGPDGDLWVGNEEGLFRASSPRWRRWRTSDLAEGNNINAILEARNGDVWMGTGAGVFIRHTDGTLEHVTAIQGTPLRVVTGLAEDREGGIWVASGSSFTGAFRWDGASWTHVGAEAGLEASHIHKIARDRRGQLWFLGIALQFGGTRNESGAFVYDGVGFTPWGIAEGLLSGRVYDVLHLEERLSPPPSVTVTPPLAASGNVYFQWQPFAFRGQQPPEEIETRYRLDDQPWSAWSVAREASALNVPLGAPTPLRSRPKASSASSLRPERPPRSASLRRFTGIHCSWLRCCSGS